MSQGIKTIIYPVTDLAAAKTVYGRLAGVEPYADEAYYVGYKVGGQDIGLDPNGHREAGVGPISYWHVDDIEKSLDALVAAGAETVRAVVDVGGGKRTAIAKDADGNVIGLLQEP